MFKPLTAILSIILIAGQALYLPAQADDQSQLLVFAQPQSATLTAGKAALEQEARQVEIQNHVVPGITLYAHNIGGDEAGRLAKDGVIVGENSTDNNIDLQSGNILITPENNITVSTRQGKISVAAGATLFVSESSNDVVIYDLLQTKPNQVSMIVGKQKLAMEPGRMLVITEQDTKDFEQLDVNCHCVAYLHAMAVSLNSKTMKAFMADFSIASALTTIQPLQRLTVSQHKEDRLALARLLKAAVVMGDFATSAARPATQVANANTVQVADANSNQN